MGWCRKLSASFSFSSSTPSFPPWPFSWWAHLAPCVNIIRRIHHDTMVVLTPKSIGATYLPNRHKPHLFRFSFSILLLLCSSCQLNHHDKLDQMKSLLNRGKWGKASKKVLENILQCGLARVLSKGKFCQSSYLNNNSGDQMIPICSLTLKKLLSNCQDVVNSFLNNRVKNITRFGLKPATARVTSTEFNQK